MHARMHPKLMQVVSGASAAVFFFQAEDGIRDWSVTGVQTCALPISHRAAEARFPLAAEQGVMGALDILEGEAGFGRAMGDGPDWDRALATLGETFHEIGRASCRERG